MFSLLKMFRELDLIFDRFRRVWIETPRNSPSASEDLSAHGKLISNHPPPLRPIIVIRLFINKEFIQDTLKILKGNIDLFF